MRCAFLANARVRLVVPESGDDAFLAAMPWRLLSHQTGGDLIALTAVDAAERVVGGTRLEDIDWVRREAAIAIRWGGAPDLAAEALRLMVAYARDELRLERVEARALEDAPPWPALLEREGFRAKGEEGRTPRVLRYGKAFAPSPD